MSTRSAEKCTDQSRTRMARRLLGRLALVFALVFRTTVVMAPAAMAYPSWYPPNGSVGPGFLAS